MIVLIRKRGARALKSKKTVNREIVFLRFICLVRTAQFDPGMRTKLVVCRGSPQPKTSRKTLPLVEVRSV